MKNKLLLCWILLVFFKINAQKIYSVANAHSHNDYENKYPFTTAYKEEFGSIEVDIFLRNDSLIVGHTLIDLQYKRTLEKLYLDPLLHKARENNGYPYKDPHLSLQLLIDIKTGAAATLNKLVQVLHKYPVLIHSKNIHFVITGNRPPESTFHLYPSFISFDGDLNKDYPKDVLKKIVMLSDNLKNYTRWNGRGITSENDKRLMDSLTKKAHRLYKKVRFWNAPDFPGAWYELVNAGVDYINTDHIPELSAFLKNLRQNERKHQKRRLL